MKKSDTKWQKSSLTKQSRNWLACERQPWTGNITVNEVHLSNHHMFFNSSQDLIHYKIKSLNFMAGCRLNLLRTMLFSYMLRLTLRHAVMQWHFSLLCYGQLSHLLICVLSLNRWASTTIFSFIATTRSIPPSSPSYRSLTSHNILTSSVWLNISSNTQYERLGLNNKNMI